jgi:hypothetical protein
MQAYIGRGVYMAIAIGITTGALLHASTLTSYTFTDWKTTVQPGSAQDVNFAPPSGTFGPAGYTTSDGFTITGPDGATTNLQETFFNGGPSVKGGSDANAQVVVTPPTGETALFFGFGSSPSGTGYTLTLSDGEIFNLAADTSLFGFSVSHPITSATFASTPGSSFVLSYIGYGTTTQTLDAGDPGPSSTPEVSTLLLIGTGLLLIGKFRRISFF